MVKIDHAVGKIDVAEVIFTGNQPVSSRIIRVCLQAVPMVDIGTGIEFASRNEAGRHESRNRYKIDGHGMTPLLSKSLKVI